MKALLRLFRAIQVEDKSQRSEVSNTLARTAQHRYLIDPAIAADESTFKAIESVLTLNSVQLNSAFHKSWKTIEDLSLEALVLQQIVHYATTYGYESLGIFDSDLVYIPKEKLEIPELESQVPLIRIKAMTAAEIQSAILSIGSGVALAENTLNDIMAVVESIPFDPSVIEQIDNHELNTRLRDLFGIVPKDPVAFLRYVISKLTDESLLIKNSSLIDKIKDANGKFLDELMTKAPDDLGSIFYRFKPLFLAMKSISRNKTFFNRLRKRAIVQNRPAPVDYLNNLTALIKQNQLDRSQLSRVLKKANNFRKIRLANALRYRISTSQSKVNSIVYRIRNGRGWATDFTWPKKQNLQAQEALSIVLNSLASSIRTRLEGKIVLIPAHVEYAMPATEKQFTGNFPTGSYFSVPEDLIVGIHWQNTNRRIDLDLSLLGLGGKLGWDGSLRSHDNSLLFSGDMTDAPGPKGATELFYIKKAMKDPQLLMVNYYNYSANSMVPTQLIVAQEKTKRFGMNYMVNPNKVIALSNLQIERRQNILGMIASVDGENRVYFANMAVGNTISSKKGASTTHSRNYLRHQLLNPLSLREVLDLAGAEIVTDREEGNGNELIDLSPDRIDKLTLIQLIQG
ncbi:MAG: hypothetical protein AAF623_03300 [Planctomycetota bacterium]